MIAILDYGSGNLRSAQHAFELTGIKTVITSDPKLCADSDGLVVPGVGAYGACMKQLVDVGGKEIILNRVAAGKPVIGICVGLQILFEQGREKGGASGVGVLPGEVSELKSEILPHIGWNTVSAGKGTKLFEGLDGASFYFVHSYAVKKAVPDAVNSWTEYGEEFLSAVERGPVSAVQFHPEKSGANGARLISNWAKSL